MADESVDAIVTDPPYGLEFMGKEWDSFRIDATPVESRAFQNWCYLWATEALRVLKPGGHLLAFGGTRTYHRLACAVEDAGFDVRDTIEWIYGSGFPKSLDVSKAIDKRAGPNYERTDREPPVTDDAKAWDGWGTALKPAHEPIVVARKPLAGSVADTVVAYGTGALNIDATRVAGQRHGYPNGVQGNTFGGTPRRGRDEPEEGHPAGRWPPNVVLSHDDECAITGRDAEGCVEGCPVRLIAEQRGHTSSPASRPRSSDPPAVATWSLGREGGVQVGHDYTGTAARFFPQFSDDDEEGSFRYVPKAKTAQRSAGIPVAVPVAAGPGGWSERPEGSAARNPHPTVKPVALMRWLVRLVAPPDGVVLDPFLGSGTTAVAAIAEERRWIGIERDPEYAAVAAARVAAAERAMRTRNLQARVDAARALPSDP